MTRIDTRRDYNNSTDPRNDLTARFRPAQEAVDRAVARMADTGEEELYVAILLPGKTRGIWYVGQEVWHPSVSVIHSTRGEAIVWGEQNLMAPGVVAYAVIYPDGEWAVFEI